MSRFPAAPTLKRSIETLQPKVEIVIVCEGKNTEPKYFEDCVDGYGSGLVKLRVIGEAGAPISVVTAAISERDELLVKRKKLKDSFEACFRVWAVFDRDEHESFDRAILLAASNNIDVAFSNPCFELWPILHLIDYGVQDDRHKLQNLLAEKMPGYMHERGAIVDFNLIKDDVGKAYKRADKLLQSRMDEGCSYGCPSTSVGILVQKIIENGKLAGRAIVATRSRR